MQNDKTFLKKSMKSMKAPSENSTDAEITTYLDPPVGIAYESPTSCVAGNLRSQIGANTHNPTTSNARQRVGLTGATHLHSRA